MSKTDNTRPIMIQWTDLTVPGYFKYWAAESGQRISPVYGGKRYMGGHAKGWRKLGRRQIRQRERINLRSATKLGRKADIDIQPMRADRRSIIWDLS